MRIRADFEMTPEEEAAYIAKAKADYPDREVTGLDLHLDDEGYVSGTVHTQPFERIRRITGYLVGTMDRWNGAKAAEENDRVKHI